MSAWCLGMLLLMRYSVDMTEKFKPVLLRPRAIQSDFCTEKPDSQLRLLKRCLVWALIR